MHWFGLHICLYLPISLSKHSTWWLTFLMWKLDGGTGLLHVTHNTANKKASIDQWPADDTDNNLNKKRANHDRFERRAIHWWLGQYWHIMYVMISEGSPTDSYHSWTTSWRVKRKFNWIQVNANALNLPADDVNYKFRAISDQPIILTATWIKKRANT